jgi:hypothetical protein
MISVIDLFSRDRVLELTTSRWARPKRAPKLVSNDTINRELDVLEAAYMKARDAWEHPVRPIKWGKHRLEKAGKKNRATTPEKAREAVALAKKLSVDFADALELSFCTGIRKNEMKTLVPARVNLQERYWVVLAKRKARQGYRERPAAADLPAQERAQDLGVGVRAGRAARHALARLAPYQRHGAGFKDQGPADRQGAARAQLGHYVDGLHPYRRVSGVGGCRDHPGDL